jgi:RNA polymerase primary sigma factor
VKKAAKKPAGRKTAVKKAAGRAAKKPATKNVAKKTAKKPSKTVQKKPVATTGSAAKFKSAAPVLDKKSVKSFTGEESQQSLLSQPMEKDSDLDEELGEEDVDIAVEADEDVEEELTLDGEDEDTDFPEKREGLLDDADDYHTP